ncbi:hypothetical protein ACQKEM_07180 [Pseudomonas sp. NPDC077382]|nr:hypothetical protein CAQ69_04705 [Stutzerimonas stutzeri]
MQFLDILLLGRQYFALRLHAIALVLKLVNRVTPRRERALLVDVGCIGMQGFLFSKLISANLMDAFILGSPNSRRAPTSR